MRRLLAVVVIAMMGCGAPPAEPPPKPPIDPDKDTVTFDCSTVAQCNGSSSSQTNPVCDTAPSMNSRVNQWQKDCIANAANCVTAHCEIQCTIRRPYEACTRK